MAELYTLRPLFPGSSESDELYKSLSFWNMTYLQDVFAVGVEAIFERLNAVSA